MPWRREGKHAEGLHFPTLYLPSMLLKKHFVLYQQVRKASPSHRPHHQQGSSAKDSIHYYPQPFCPSSEFTSTKCFFPSEKKTIFRERGSSMRERTKKQRHQNLAKLHFGERHGESSLGAGFGNAMHNNPALQKSPQAFGTCRDWLSCGENRLFSFFCKSYPPWREKKAHVTTSHPHQYYVHRRHRSGRSQSPPPH